jgi:hypothetical protein
MRSSPLQHIQHNAERRGLDVAADPHTVTARQLDLYTRISQMGLISKVYYL